MAAHADSFFDGLDDAEDVAASSTPEPVAEPAAVAEPEKPAEAAKAVEPEAKANDSKAPAAEPEKAAAKPAEPASREAPSDKAAAVPAQKPAERPDPKDWVPVGAHIELRNQFKAMQEQLAALQRAQQPAEKPAEKPAPVDFVQDPKGYVDQGLKQVIEKLESAVKPVAQTAEQATVTAAQAQFQHALTVAEQSFAAQTPDYHQALNHIRGLREAELSMLHPGVPVAEIRQFMAQEEIQLAANLMRSGRNPAEVAYNLAKARGWQKPQPPAPEPAKPAPAAEVAKLLPDVPEPKKLAPDLTLGTGTGSPVTEEAYEDPFEAARKELFGARKRA